MSEQRRAPTRQPAVKSPCVRNCCLDKHDICLGCHRSLTEICAWGQAGATERLKILGKAAQRKQQRTLDQTERT